jgi:CPA2 family monovalent cation:H+ antiporter-2
MTPILGAGDPALMSSLFVVLALAGLTALAMGRAGIAAIPAFLVAGAIAGPHALGLVPDAGQLAGISELAIVLLLFGIGLHIEPGELGKGSMSLVIAGIGAVVACVALLFPVALLFGLDWAPALAVAMALAVSSTAVVLRRLMQRRELRHPTGRLALAILIVQDLAVPVLLIAIDALGRLNAGGDTAPNPVRIALVATASVAGVAGLLVAARLVLPKILRQASIVGSDEVMLALGVATAIGAALATNALGFSYELGAFLSGLILGATPFRHQVGALIGPARDFFLAVFFTTLGMAIDPAPLADLWPAVLIGGTVMIVIKTVAIGGAAWATWGTGLVAATAGLTLAQAGEFSLILLEAGHDKGLIDDRTQTAAVAIVVLSLILTPVPIALGRWMNPLLSRLPSAPWRRAGAGNDGHDDAHEGVRCIIGGFGPIGRVAADHLERVGVRTTIIELNEKTVRTNTALGRDMVYGDLSRPEILESAGVRSAQALILTSPDENANLRACQIGRSMSPTMCIVTRMNHLGKGLQAKSLGADAIVVEEVAAAEAMERIVAERFGVDPEKLRGESLTES